MTANNHSFDSNFEVFLADTPESKALHYNIRYQVYCDEMGYENKDKFTDEQEYDQWDMNHSVHFLVRDKHRKHWVGAMRLVLPDKNALPLEQHCTLKEKISRDQYQQSLELSRLCVLKEVRRFTAKKFAPYGILTEENVPENSNVTVLHNYKNLGLTLMWGLFRAMTLYCNENNVKDLYMLVSPALAYAIRKEGFSVEQVGKACRYRGKRIPYKCNIANVVENAMWKKDYKNGFSLCSDMLEEDSAYLKRAY
jgi:N-acyl amino acid synthase of PEP-CTERM/exosortase system